MVKLRLPCCQESTAALGQGAPHTCVRRYVHKRQGAEAR